MFIQNTSLFKPLKVLQVKPTADRDDSEVNEIDGNILEKNNGHPDYIGRENLDDKQRNAEDVAEQSNECNAGNQVADETYNARFRNAFSVFFPYSPE